MLPLIGITTSFNYRDDKASLNWSYVKAIEQSGGIPVAVAPLSDKAVLLGLVECLDGIILSGGPDVDPFYYGEEPQPQLGDLCPKRDDAELYLAREMFKTGTPILGICRGLQILNIALGGSVFQDIPSSIKTTLKHVQDAPRWHGSHSIEFTGDSKIYGIIGQSSIHVNSFHHQSVKDIASTLKVTAVAQDGVVEAAESKDPGAFCIGVQWHPEDMIHRDSRQLGIFQEFIRFIKDKQRE